jgi:hypothetical protein
MRISEIKKGVYGAFASARLEDNVDEQILSCLIYDIVKRILSSDDQVQNDIRSLAASYIPGMVKKLDEFRSSFASYSTMRSEIESFSKPTFLSFSSREISRIVSLYQDRTKVVPFSSVFFSQYMYKLINVPEMDYKRLSNIHRRLMSPIARFYSEQYDGADSDLEIFTALGYPDRPGKEILFTVKNVDPSRIVSDIKTSRIPISRNSEYQEVRVKGKYVMVVSK